MGKLSERTIKSINKKMDEAKKNKYFVYKSFQNASVTKSEDTINYTLEKNDWIYATFNDLLGFKFDPFNEPSNDRVRNEKDYPNHNKTSEKYGNRLIDGETMIQRNIYLNNMLYHQLETIIDYEINIPKERKKASIDLLAYKKDNGKITFIIEELKVCKFVSGEDLKKEDAKDLLLRAMMEALLYGCYFKKALEDKGENLVKYLMKKIKDVSIDQIKNAKIEYYIIAPESIINQKNQEWFKKFDTNKFSFFTLSQVSQATEIVGKVEDKIKYFNIEKKA